ncbi:hypothetical protein [Candidatus Methanoperedens nitratireducens]|uniref:Uncharacterized protein n=1 Tax=Candidatus Methanoperedens nitratireducens TaxID=1392998 RepID=A0A284VLV5_9EURY|nr:hypothetical protein [Candidatus Methanoperedens nitroreducens]SNQ60255.1 membrane hypothetical protein [Candidatus Methanoperedens nitroreducens]
MNEIETETLSEKKPMAALEQQDSGTYIGLLLGGIILATGAVVLFSDLESTFSTRGIDITLSIIFRMGLMLASAYGAISCFFGLYRIAALNRMLSGKIGEEFEDFVLYTRPFIEEVIRQRLVVEKVMDKLETMEKRSIESTAVQQESKSAVSTKWWEFLFYVALLTNISIGLYVYLEAHPYEMVPYSIIILGIAWWVLMAKYFGILFDPRGVYMPAFFIAALPTLSIVLRIFLAPYQALFIVFIGLFFYVAAMYYYYRYITMGIPLFSIAKLREEIEISKKARAEKPEIEAKKESILEQALSRIKSQEVIEKPAPLHVIRTESEIRALKISLKDVIRSAFRAKIQSIRLGFMSLIWPRAVCQNGRKISCTGLIMAFLGAVSIITFPAIYEDVFLEAVLFGIVLLATGYSLAGKREKRIFTISSSLFFAGILLSLGTAISFYFLSVESLVENILKIAMQYIAGILFLVLDIFIDRRPKK